MNAPLPSETVALPNIRVSRFNAAALGASLDHFSDPKVLAAGQVSVVDLQAIANRFGARWPMRRDPVHEHVRATLDRILGSSAFHLPITDTDVLVCQPDRPRLAGQALCLRALREILTHFLGEAELADIGVHEVIKLSPEGVEARRVDARAASAEIELAEPTRGFVNPSTETGALGRSDQWTPFVTSNGLAVQVKSRLEPVLQLSGQRRMGLRLTRYVSLVSTGRPLRPTDSARLTGADLLRIDIAGLLCALEDLESQPDRPPAVVFPVTLASLTHPAGRARIVQGLREARARVQAGVVSELADLDGAPSPTLAQSMAVVRPFSVLVIGGVSDLASGAGRHLRGLGFHGVATQVPRGLSGAAFHGWAAPAIAGGKKIAKSVLLYGLDPDAVDMAQSLGATHATLVR